MYTIFNFCWLYCVFMCTCVWLGRCSVKVNIFYNNKLLYAVNGYCMLKVLLHEII